MSWTCRQEIPPVDVLLAHAQVCPTVASSPSPQGLGQEFVLPQIGFPSQLVIRGAWQTREDELLRDAVTRFGLYRWNSVAAVIPGRSPTQCRERWMFRIGPGLNKSPFQEWEDELIIRERERVGNHWTSIAAKLPGRTSCSVKNRWYSVLKKHQKRAKMAKQTRQMMPFDIPSLLCHPIQPRSVVVCCSRC
jgi:hypothetical protein